MTLARILLLFLICAVARAEKPKGFLFIPSKGDGPFPVAVWLHGYRGYSPQGYAPRASQAEMQGHADVIGAVIIGFPATTDLGNGTQQWSEESVADHAYIQAKLKELAKTHKLDLTRVGLFGFSQGALVAGDIASLYPNSYLGAILLSPGGIGTAKPSSMKLPEHARQIFFCFCGAEEHPDNVNLTKAYAQHFKTVLGTQTTLKLYPGVPDHTRPPDFMEKFPEWMAEILKKRG